MMLSLMLSSQEQMRSMSKRVWDGFACSVVRGTSLSRWERAGGRRLLKDGGEEHVCASQLTPQRSTHSQAFRPAPRSVCQVPAGPLVLSRVQLHPPQNHQQGCVIVQRRGQA